MIAIATKKQRRIRDGDLFFWLTLAAWAFALGWLLHGIGGAL